jgi:hypothetical protein
MLCLLEFPSLKLRDAYLQTLGSIYTEVNERLRSVACECSSVLRHEIKVSTNLFIQRLHSTTNNFNGDFSFNQCSILIGKFFAKYILAVKSVRKKF